MTDWAADTKSGRVEPSTPPTIEADRMPPVSLNSSLRDEIRQRVSNLKALQARFSREREEFASSQLKRMSVSDRTVRSIFAKISAAESKQY